MWFYGLVDVESLEKRVLLGENYDYISINSGKRGEGRREKSLQEKSVSL